MASICKGALTIRNDEQEEDDNDDDDDALPAKWHSNKTTYPCQHKSK